MRKIEREMLDALKHEYYWRKDNTSVEWGGSDEDDRAGEVRLHGNLIAEYYPHQGELYLRDAGWRTVTTKSRLNALITELVGPEAGISQKNYEWYLTYNGATLKWLGQGTLVTTK